MLPSQIKEWAQNKYQENLLVKSDKIVAMLAAYKKKEKISSCEYARKNTFTNDGLPFLRAEEFFEGTFKGKQV